MISFVFLVRLLAEYLLYLQLGLALLFFIRYRRLQPLFFTLFLTWLTVTFIKRYFYFPRPFIISGFHPLVGYLLDGSFPSAHSALSFAAATLTYLYHRRWGIALLIFAFLIAIGRVLAGVHTFLDISAGIVLGGSIAFIVKRWKS